MCNSRQISRLGERFLSQTEFLEIVMSGETHRLGDVLHILPGVKFIEYMLSADEEGDTPLLKVLAEGHVPMAIVLLDLLQRSKAANLCFSITDIIDKTDHNGLSPLMIAVDRSRRVVKTLLELGANLNLQVTNFALGADEEWIEDEEERTAIATYGETPIIKGATALHIAISVQAPIESVQALLEHEQMDLTLRTVLQGDILITTLLQYIKVLEIDEVSLVKKLENIYYTFQVINAILKQSHRLSLFDSKGCTMFHHLAYLPQTSKANLLPLFGALKQAYPQFIKYLINCPDNLGIRPLVELIISSRSRYLCDYLELFFSLGAKTNLSFPLEESWLELFDIPVTTHPDAAMPCAMVLSAENTATCYINGQAVVIDEELSLLAILMLRCLINPKIDMLALVRLCVEYCVPIKNDARALAAVISSDVLELLDVGLIIQLARSNPQRYHSFFPQVKNGALLASTTPKRTRPAPEEDGDPYEQQPIPKQQRRSR